MEYYFWESVGWTADIFFVSAYALVSRKKLDPEGAAYNSMNLIGAVLYGTYAAYKIAIPVIVLEIIWGSIAASALWKAFSMTAKALVLWEWFLTKTKIPALWKRFSRGPEKKS